jgi:hypothetical protein
MKCAVCLVTLTGRQKKFCSRGCKNKFGNNVYQNYVAQQNRGRDRKLELINRFGGACARCGYSKNFAAMEFNHLDPQNKAFQLV